MDSLGQIKDVTKISGAFSDFTKAVENKKGLEAVEYVDDSTISYFNLILPYIKNLNEASTDSLYIQNAGVIKWFHNNLKTEELTKLNDNNFISSIISNGLYQNLNLGRFHPGRISLNGDRAKAYLTTFSTQEETECLFSKEGKKWKISLKLITAYLVHNH